MTGQKIHVGIDATTWSNDRGFGRFTREFVGALAERARQPDSGFRYTLVFDQPPAFPMPEGVETIIESTKGNLNEASQGDNARSIGYLWMMGQIVRQAGFDLFYYPAVYSYFPLLSRVPKVVCYHDTTAERLPEYLFPTKMNHRLWQIKTWLAKQQTTRAMTVSNSSADDMVTYLKIPRDKIDVVTEGAGPEFQPRASSEPGLVIRRQHNIPDGAHVLTYVGGMNARKNILTLLKAMPQIVAARPDVHLAIVGSTSGKSFWDNVPELMAFVAEHPPLEQNVHFTGYPPDEALVDLFSTTAALVFPSLWEGFGLPAVEAMSCGVPVLASDRASLPEVIGDAGLFYDLLDLDDITSTILRFFNEDGLQAALTAKALPQAAKFSWERAAELGEKSFLRCYAEKRGSKSS